MHALLVWIPAYAHCCPGKCDAYLRRSGGGRSPDARMALRVFAWIPAYAGTTMVLSLAKTQSARLFAILRANRRVSGFSPDSSGRTPGRPGVGSSRLATIFTPPSSPSSSSAASTPSAPSSPREVSSAPTCTEELSPARPLCRIYRSPQPPALENRARSDRLTRLSRFFAAAWAFSRTCLRAPPERRRLGSLTRFTRS